MSLMNYNEYLALQEIYNATNGDHWVWSDDVTYDGAKWVFDNFTKNNPCRKFWQGVYCLTFDCPDTGCEIFSINLTAFNLSGILPSLGGKFGSLYFFDAGENNLRGPLPNIYPMPNLQMFNVSYNEFTGQIPDMFHDMNSLFLLYLSSNQFHGTIPPSIYRLPALQYLNLYDNFLKDTIPSHVNKLSHLIYFNVAGNLMHGTIPESLFTIPNITQVFLGTNYFHGTLPSYLGKHLEILRACDLSLSGTIPEKLCLNKDLSFLSIFNNFLTGPYPPCLSELPKMTALQIQMNFLTGSLTHAFNSSLQTALEIVDISDNGFSGKLPAELFSLPALTTIAAGKNCFRGEFPDSICLGNRLETVSLDGLGASDQCLVTLWDPFDYSNAYFGGLLEGGIPSCIWSLPNITSLHMSGNGFSGSLPDFYCDGDYSGQCGISSSLKDVVLTHNLLTGTIPLSFQHYPFQYIDLSYNKLKGHIDSMTNYSLSYSANASGAIVHLDNNRLTGKLPRQFLDAYNIDVLTGNLFACAGFGREETVAHDRGSRIAICGSEELDGALASWGYYALFALIILLVITLLTRFIRRSMDIIKKGYRSILYTLEYIREVQHYTSDISGEEDERFSNIYHLLSALTLTRRISWIMAAFAMTICLPVYSIFYIASNGKYSTHTDRYSWIVTAVFLTGELPAAICFFMWSIPILLVIHSIVKHYNLHAVKEQSTVLDHIFSLVSSTSDKLRDSFQNNFLAAPFLYSDIRSSFMSQQGKLSGPLAEPERVSTSIKSDLTDSGQTPSLLDNSIKKESNPSDKPRGSLFNFPTWGRSSLVSDKSPVALDLSQQVTYQERGEYWTNFLKYFVIFTLNFCLIVAINAAYLVVQNGEDVASNVKIAVQVLMAAFKIFWNIFALRLMMTHLPYQKNSVKLHVGMLVFNSIFAPCIATCFTDSACFKDCFVAPDSIPISYNVNACIESYQEFNYNTNIVVTVCTHFQNSEFATVFTPTFIYYYTCGSKLLTAYTPVFIYIYTILLIFLPILYIILAALGTDRWPASVIAAIDGVVRPHDRGKIPFVKLIRPSAMQANMINHIVVLFTFGICSPVLALVMSLTLTIDTLMWQVIITRYIKYDTMDSPFCPKYNVNEHVSPKYRSKNSFRSLPLWFRQYDDYDEYNHDTSDSNPKIIEKKNSDASEEKEVDEYVKNPVNLLSTERTSLVESSKDSRLTNDVIYKLLYNSGHPIGAPHPDDSQREGNYQQKVKEEARLYELSTVCGETWKSIRNAMWLVMYCSVFFYVCILFDIAGDSSGWKGAIWTVVYGFVFVTFTRLFFVDCMRFVYDRWIGGYSYRRVVME